MYTASVFLCSRVLSADDNSIQTILQCQLTHIWRVTLSFSHIMFRHIYIMTLVEFITTKTTYQVWKRVIICMQPLLITGDTLREINNGR